MKNRETKQIQIEAENLGGLAGKTKIEIQPGINIIEAPNAAGKTSIVGAFTLSVLPQKKLRSMLIFCIQKKLVDG